MASATTTGQMFFIPAHPFWWLTMIALDVVALWGRAPAAASRKALAAVGAAVVDETGTVVDLAPAGCRRSRS